MNEAEYDDKEIAGWSPFDADLEHGATVMKCLLRGQHPGSHRTALMSALWGIRREQMRRWRLNETAANDE